MPIIWNNTQYSTYAEAGAAANPPCSTMAMYHRIKRRLTCDADVNPRQQVRVKRLSDGRIFASMAALARAEGITRQAVYQSIAMNRGKYATCNDNE